MNGCECVDACRVESFSPEASYSVMPSDLRVLGRAHEKIHQNYLSAVGMRQRTGAVIVDTLIMFESKLKIFNSAMNFVSSSVLDKTSSVPVIVEDIISDLLKDAGQGIVSSLFGDHQLFIDAFQREHLQHQTDFKGALNKALTYLNNLQALIDSLTRGYFVHSEVANLVQKELSKDLTSIADAAKLYYRSIHYAESQFVPTTMHSTDRDKIYLCACVFKYSCSVGHPDEAKSFSNVVEDIAQIWECARNELGAHIERIDSTGFETKGTSGITGNVADYSADHCVLPLIQHMAKFRGTAEMAIACTDEYYNFLQDTSDWLKTVKPVVQSHAKSLIQEEEMKVLQE